MTSLATRATHVARPLKVLIPLIQSEIERGDAAGHDNYVHAGAMLIEAKEQVAHGGWGRWLSSNFDLSIRTAQTYMAWARARSDEMRTGGSQTSYSSMRDMRGATERERNERNSKQQQQFRRTMREIARDDFAQERQRVEDEVALHRKLAEELVDLGYRALATRLHPDRGGSKDAMARLNRIRDELRHVAQTRRFV